MSVQSKIAPEGAKTTNKKVLTFVEEAKALFKPEAVHWCNGSEAEYQEFLKLWRDADPDNPILLQAKAEIARLR